MKRVLVPLSGDESDEAIVPLVGTLARQSGATVRLLRVFPVPEAITHALDFVGSRRRVIAYADQQMDALKGQGLAYLQTIAPELDGIPTEPLVGFGDPVAEILLEAARFDADLIAVATTRRSRLRRAFSPGVAEQVARRASVPVLLLRV